MLLQQSKIIGLPVASVQAGHRIGVVSDFVIKPQGLQVSALIIDSPQSSEPLYLHTEDILEVRHQGILIDHNDQLMESEGLVRLSELLDLDFQVIGKHVNTKSGKRVGSIVDFSILTQGWNIQKIYTEPSLIRILSKPDRIIDRSQIIKVTDRDIIIKDAAIQAKQKFSQTIAKRLALKELRTQQNAAKRS